MTVAEKRTAELLSPAGSYEGFQAALGAGADAVYMGGSFFGARAYAKNFTEEEVLAAIKEAHILGKKVYLTVNTLLKNQELYGKLYDYLAPYYQEGLDAVIVQDFGVFSFIRREFPGLPLHASTQMTITGPEGMKFLEKLGAKRVVAARELSLIELREMHRASSLEIEAFVHGALCYCYSGQCLMSSLIGGRSGNRGRCAQPCRLPYTAPAQKKHGPNILSLKDMNTLEILPDILESGVCSLKIEGRMKQPEYTATVTQIYRKYLDLYLEKGREGYRTEPADLQLLREIFSRGGSSKGYYLQHNGPSMIDYEGEKKTKEVETVLQRKKAGITGNLFLKEGGPARLSLKYGEFSVLEEGDVVQTAKNAPMDAGSLQKQMDKLGNTCFQWDTLQVTAEGNVFLPVRSLNTLRRNAIGSLEEQISRKYRRALNPGTVSAGLREPAPVPFKEKDMALYVSCQDVETARTLMEEPALSGMYLPFHVMKECLSDGLKRNLSMYLSFPEIQRGPIPEEVMEKAGEWLSRGMKGFLVSSTEILGRLYEEKLFPCTRLDAGLYIWNDEAKDFFRKLGTEGDTIPVELNEKELRRRDNTGSELLVYGYLPMMLSAQCVRKTTLGCSRKEETVPFKDRFGNTFTAK
ncbi:MAG: U32 family peptidase, partial [Blautia sp.]|nr:U32 family peptidase [Blautia sp.]